MEETTTPIAEAPEESRKAALYDAFAPALENLARKYGLPDPTDAAALAGALEQEKTADQEKRKTQAGRLYDAWMDQAEKTREKYPNFDLARELQDPRFQDLLKARVDVSTAYEVLHRQELLSHMEQGLMRKLTQGGLRPRENGTASQGAAVTRQDITRMSRSERQAIIRRVQQGEKITF